MGYIKKILNYNTYIHSDNTINHITKQISEQLFDSLFVWSMPNLFSEAVSSTYNFPIQYEQITERTLTFIPSNRNNKD